MRKYMSTLLSLSLMPTIAAAADVSVDLNDRVVHAEYHDQPFKNPMEFAIGGYHRENEGDLIEGNLLKHDRMTNLRDVQFAIGGDAGVLDGDPSTGTFLGLALAANYVLPDLKGFNLGLEAVVAPSVLCSEDINRVFKIGAVLSYRIMRTADVFLGYRHMRITTEQEGAIDYDDSLNVGVRFRL